LSRLGWHGGTEHWQWTGCIDLSVLNVLDETSEFTPFATYHDNAENDDDEESNR
jgi:hypothetical protein